MPEGRALKYVPVDDAFMQKAKQAQETYAGDPLFPVGLALVKNGEVIVQAGNGFNKGPNEVHICPRIVLECPSGTGYDLCTLHDAPGHAEQMAVKVAQEQGIDIVGADAYMYGHWWACEPCWTALIDAGIRDLYVTDDAHERFSRDAVFAQTLKPSVKSAYVSGALTNLASEIMDTHKAYYETIAATCEELGIQGYVPHLHSDPEKNMELPARDVFDLDSEELVKKDVTIADVTHPSLGTGSELMLAWMKQKPIVLLSKRGTKVSRFAKGNPAVVYHLEYDDYDGALRGLKNILRQL